MANQMFTKEKYSMETIDIKRPVETVCQEAKEAVPPVCLKVKQPVEAVCQEARETVPLACPKVKQPMEAVCQETREAVLAVCLRVKQPVESVCRDAKKSVCQTVKIAGKESHIRRGLDSVAVRMPVYRSVKRAHEHELTLQDASLLDGKELFIQEAEPVVSETIVLDCVNSKRVDDNLTLQELFTK